MTENGTKGFWPLKLIAVILAAALLLSLASPSVMGLLSAVVEGKTKLGASNTPEEYAYSNDYALATVAIANEDYEQAVIHLEKSMELAADESPEIRAELYLKSASVYILTGEIAKAEPLLDKALELEGDLHQALLLRAQIHIDSGRIQQAMDDMQAYIRLVPEDDSMKLTLAELYELQGDYTMAAEQYDMLYQEQTEDSHFLNSLRCRFLAGEHETAMKEFDDYLERCEADSDYYPTALFLKAACHLQIGQPGEAEEFFTLALEQGYDKAGCYEQLAICSFELGDYLKTVEYGEMLEETGMQPVTPELFYQRMGAALVMTERYEEAILYLDAAEGYESKLVGNAYYRGISNLALANYQEAAENFTKSIEENFLVQFCYYNRGVCHVQLENFEQAYSDMEASLSSGSDASLMEAAADVMAQLDAYFQDQEV